MLLSICRADHRRGLANRFPRRHNKSLTLSSGFPLPTAIAYYGPHRGAAPEGGFIDAWVFRSLLRPARTLLARAAMGRALAPQ